MKKVLISAILLTLMACGPKAATPNNTINAPDVRYGDGGGYFVPPEQTSGDEDDPVFIDPVTGEPVKEEDELFCYIDHFELERGPYVINGLFLQGVFSRFERDKEIVHGHTGDFIYLVDVRAASTEVPFSSFIKRAEVSVGDDLIAWVDEVPRGEHEVTPNFDGSINLAKYGYNFTGTGVVWARYPAVQTEINLWMKFRRHYGCRKAQ